MLRVRFYLLPQPADVHVHRALTFQVRGKVPHFLDNLLAGERLPQVARWRLPAFTAREVVLFSSDLQPGGAVYTALRRFPAGV